MTDQQHAVLNWTGHRGLTVCGGFVRDMISRDEPNDMDIFSNDIMGDSQASLKESFWGSAPKLIQRWCSIRVTDGILWLEFMLPFVFHDLSCNCIGLFGSQLVRIPNILGLPLEEIITHCETKSYQMLRVSAKARAERMDRKGWKRLTPQPLVHSVL